MRTHTRLQMIAGVSLVALTMGFVTRPVLAAKAQKPPVPPVEAVRKQLLKLRHTGSQTLSIICDVSPSDLALVRPGVAFQCQR